MFIQMHKLKQTLIVQIPLEPHSIHILGVCGKSTSFVIPV